MGLNFSKEKERTCSICSTCSNVLTENDTKADKITNSEKLNYTKEPYFQNTKENESSQNLTQRIPSNLTPNYNTNKKFSIAQRCLLSNDLSDKKSSRLIKKPIPPQSLMHLNNTTTNKSIDYKTIKNQKDFLTRKISDVDVNIYNILLIVTYLIR